MMESNIELKHLREHRHLPHTVEQYLSENAKDSEGFPDGLLRWLARREKVLMPPHSESSPVTRPAGARSQPVTIGNI